MHMSSLLDAFDRFDTECKGFLTKAGLSKALGPDAVDNIDEVMNKMDPDKTGIVSRERFMHYMTETMKNEADAEARRDQVAAQIIDEEIKAQSKQSRKSRTIVRCWSLSEMLPSPPKSRDKEG